MNIQWYPSESTTEKPLVDCGSSASSVFLHRNVMEEKREDPRTGEIYTVWVYEEAKITHEEYEQMLTEEITRLTPYAVTKTAYIEDTETAFTDVPDGIMSVSVKDSEGNYPDYTTERTGSRVVFHFSEPLTKVTTVTISVL